VYANGAGGSQGARFGTAGPPVTNHGAVFVALPYSGGLHTPCLLDGRPVTYVVSLHRPVCCVFATVFLSGGTPKAIDGKAFAARVARRHTGTRRLVRSTDERRPMDRVGGPNMSSLRRWSGRKPAELPGSAACWWRGFRPFARPTTWPRSRFDPGPTDSLGPKAVPESIVADRADPSRKRSAPSSGLNINLRVTTCNRHLMICRGVSGRCLLVSVCFRDYPHPELTGCTSLFMCKGGGSC